MNRSHFALALGVAVGMVLDLLGLVIRYPLTASMGPTAGTLGASVIDESQSDITSVPDVVELDDE